MGLHAASYEYQHDVIVAAGPGMVSSAVVGTATAPYRRVLTLLQTQHSNPRLPVPRWTWARPPPTSKCVSRVGRSHRSGSSSTGRTQSLTCSRS